MRCQLTFLHCIKVDSVQVPHIYWFVCHKL